MNIKVIQVQERQDALLKASDLPEEKKAELMLKMQSYTDTLKQMKQQADVLILVLLEDGQRVFKRR